MPLSVKDGMGAWIKDFKDSNAPQFKGKSDKERREMAIAAYMSAKKGDDSTDEGFVSAAQRRAVWANKADGGKGHPDNKKKSKKESTQYLMRHSVNGKRYLVSENYVERMQNVGYTILEKTENLPFDPDPKKPASKNSDGSTTKPMSRAKQLAKMARDRNMKKESVELDEMFASTTEPHKDGHRPKVVKTQPNGKTTMSYLGQHVYKSKEHARNAADHIAKGMRKGRASDSYIQDFARRHHKEHGMKESVEDSMKESNDGYYAYQRAKEKYHKDNPGSNFDRAPEHHKQKYIHPEMQKRGYKKQGSTWVKESVELEEMKANAAYTKAAKDIKAYAAKSGGIDKKDMMNFAADLDLMGRAPNILQAGRILDRINKRFKGYDTDVRDRLSMYLKKHGLMESVQENVSDIEYTLDEAKTYDQNSDTIHKVSGREVKKHDADATAHLDKADYHRKKANEIKAAGGSSNAVKAHRDAAKAHGLAHDAKNIFHAVRKRDWLGRHPTPEWKLHRLHKSTEVANAASKKAESHMESVQENVSDIENTARTYLDSDKVKVKKAGKDTHIHVSSYHNHRDLVKHINQLHKKNYKVKAVDNTPNGKRITVGESVNEATYGTQTQRMMSPLQKIRQDKEKADRDRDGKLKSTALPMKKKKEEVEEAGSPERYKMIKKAGDKYNKEKKKAERDAMKAMAKDKDMMGENNSAPQTAAHRRAQSGSRYSDIMKKRQADNEKARQALKDPSHNPAWANSKSKTEETVSELKKSTLGSYVKKASQDAAAKAYRSAMDANAPAYNPDQRDRSGINYMKSVKRQKGIARATDKLTKEAKSFDQKFKDHLKFATSKSPAVQAYMKKRAADRDAMNKKNDPNAAKKGYALTAVPPERKNVKLRKHKQKQQ